MEAIAVPMRIHEDGMNMAFKMVYGDQRLAQSERQRLGVQDADQQCSGQAWALSYRYRIEILEGDTGLGHSGAHHRDQVAEMFARGEFGDDAAISRMQFDLAGNHVGQDLLARTHDGGRGFVAAAFDPEDQAAPSRRHRSILKTSGSERRHGAPAAKMARSCYFAAGLG